MPHSPLASAMRQALPGLRMKFSSKTPPGSKKLVWRISPGAPKGEWVEPAAIPPPKVAPPDRDSSTWAMSSFDLQYGADVTDVSDTVPADLLDELFRAPDEPPKTPGK
jgi:hypothetical protein